MKVIIIMIMEEIMITMMQTDCFNPLEVRKHLHCLVNI